MGTEPLNATVKCRVPGPIKEALDKIAADRHLDLSDITREALREYVSRKGETASKPPNGAASNGGPQTELGLDKKEAA